MTLAPLQNFKNSPCFCLHICHLLLLLICHFLCIELWVWGLSVECFYYFIFLSSSVLRIRGPSKQFLPVYHLCSSSGEAILIGGFQIMSIVLSFTILSAAKQLTFPFCLFLFLFYFLHAPKIRTACCKESRTWHNSRRNDFQRTLNKCNFFSFLHLPKSLNSVTAPLSSTHLAFTGMLF